MPIPPDPIVTVPMVTPFDTAERIDFEALEFNLERWQESPAAGFIVGTQSGEEWSISECEKLELLRRTAACLSGDRFAVGGIDCPSVTESLRRAEAFADAGAEMIRVRFPRDRSSVEPYFDELLPRTPLPVLLMHQTDPAAFGHAAQPAGPPELLAEITNRDNVFGYVTDHDVRWEARVRWGVRDDRRFWICNGSLILHGTLIGCNGTTTAFANIWPTALHELLTRGMAGHYNDAMELQTWIQKIDAIMLPHRGAGIKAAMKLLGFRGMNVRRPGIPVSADTRQRLEETMRASGLMAHT